MKSWIRRFALLAVMGSIVGGVVMTGCTPPPEEADTTVVTPPAEGGDTTVVTPPAEGEAPAEDAPADDAPAPDVE